MELYINGTGILSAAGSNNSSDFPGTLSDQETNRLMCKEPDYTGMIPPMQLRRMSKVIRMGIAASKLAFENAGVEKPDALSIGTAMGCLHDTEIFLAKMVEQEEQMLTPTAFIQSTHNTVGGQIALLTGCYGHNLTYVHRGHSFEHALINAQLYLDDHAGERILIGGIDEVTDTSFAILRQSGIYRNENTVPRDLLQDISNGSIGGEGASFFLVTDKKEQNSKLCIKDLSLFTSKDANEAIQKVQDVLKRNNLKAADIGLALLGNSGDKRTNGFYQQLSNEVLKGAPQATFKQFAGEYATVSAFALGVLCHATEKKEFPELMMLNDKPPVLDRMIIINHYMHYYSCWYVEAV